MIVRRALRSIQVRLLPPRPKPLILMYHRIADAPLDPWGTAVSPAHFEQHLAVLRHHRYPLPLAEFVKRLLAKTLPENAVAVTLDDGYADNLYTAKPRLAAADVPATVFLATGYLGKVSEFWWDELARMILTGKGPMSFEITFRDRTLQFDLKEESGAADNWQAWLEPPRTPRQKAFLAIWSSLRSLERRERELLMNELGRLTGLLPGRSILSRPMTLEEVRVLVGDHLVAAGAHTVHHSALTEIDREARRFEIAESKHFAEALTDDGVTAFAYPFGAFDVEARSDVTAAEFTCACSTRHGLVSVDSDLFALPRIHVPDMDGDLFERSLRYASMANLAA